MADKCKYNRKHGPATLLLCGGFSCPAWERSAHAHHLYPVFNHVCRGITVCLKESMVEDLYFPELDHRTLKGQYVLVLKRRNRNVMKPTCNLDKNQQRSACRPNFFLQISMLSAAFPAKVVGAANDKLD